MWAKRRNRVAGATVVLLLALLAAADAVPVNAAPDGPRVEATTMTF